MAGKPTARASARWPSYRRPSNPPSAPGGHAVRLKAEVLPGGLPFLRPRSFLTGSLPFRPSPSLASAIYGRCYFGRSVPAFLPLVSLLVFDFSFVPSSGDDDDDTDDPDRSWSRKSRPPLPVPKSSAVRLRGPTESSIAGTRGWRRRRTSSQYVRSTWTTDSLREFAESLWENSL